MIDLTLETEEELLEEKIASAPKLSPGHSLFDAHVAKDLQSNIKYMTTKFGFFIPAIDHISDLDGLVHYLGQKISVGNVCLYCEKSLGSLEAVQGHMRDSDHCLMQWDDQSEYEQWYNFPQVKSIAECINENGEIENTYLAGAYIEPSGELVLANGTVLGHRAYKTYYNQNQGRATNAQLITSLMQEHKRLAAKEYQKRVNMDKKYIHKQYAKNLKVGMIHNQQKHYRDQNPII